MLTDPPLPCRTNPRIPFTVLQSVIVRMVIPMSKRPPPTPRPGDGGLGRGMRGATPFAAGGGFQRAISPLGLNASSPFGLSARSPLGLNARSPPLGAGAAGGIGLGAGALGPHAFGFHPRIDSPF